ncbi:hypothetical protein J3F83DRAFT_101796 [Trichoderma novae-zelandiae]
MQLYALHARTTGYYYDYHVQDLSFSFPQAVHMEYPIQLAVPPCTIPCCSQAGLSCCCVSSSILAHAQSVKSHRPTADMCPFRITITYRLLLFSQFSTRNTEWLP